MKLTIKPSAVSGNVVAPPSKSMTHRALAIAALAPGRSKVRNPLLAKDTEATSTILQKIGVKITFGKDWLIEGGNLQAPTEELYCGESGTTLRLMAAICALIDGECRVTMGSSLSTRPITPLLEALEQIGVHSKAQEGYGLATIIGTGRINGGVARLRGDISSQFVSALLTVAPLADSPVRIELTTKLESRPYVAMTMDVMSAFGIEAKASHDMRRFTAPLKPYETTTLTIEGDWSSASYPLVAGAMAGDVMVKGLKPSSFQADKAMLSLLMEMGADISVTGYDVKASSSTLHGIDMNLSDCPDLFPIICVLCAAADGVSHLTGLARLKLKESDRISAMAQGLTRMGVNIRYDKDSASIIGGPIQGSEVESFGDHRVAMSLAVLALKARGETTIRDAECVSKSYPGFWDDLESIGVRIKR